MHSREPGLYETIKPEDKRRQLNDEIPFLSIFSAGFESQQAYCALASPCSLASQTPSSLQTSLSQAVHPWMTMMRHQAPRPLGIETYPCCSSSGKTPAGWSRSSKLFADLNLLAHFYVTLSSSPDLISLSQAGLSSGACKPGISDSVAQHCGICGKRNLGFTLQEQILDNLDEHDPFLMVVGQHLER